LKGFFNANADSFGFVQARNNDGNFSLITHGMRFGGFDSAGRLKRYAKSSRHAIGLVIGAAEFTIVVGVDGNTLV
jgi:hypothetical protein